MSSKRAVLAYPSLSCSLAHCHLYLAHSPLPLSLSLCVQDSGNFPLPGGVKCNGDSSISVYNCSNGALDYTVVVGIFAFLLASFFLVATFLNEFTSSLVYGNFDFISGHVPRISQRYATPRAP